MATNARPTTELYVTTKDEVGALAKCTVALREQGINIEAVIAYQMENNAFFHFVTTDNTKAKTLLTDGGYNVKENDVVFWNASNTPGTLNKGTSALAEKGINITYLYGSGGAGNTMSWIVLNTNNNKEATNTLNTL